MIESIEKLRERTSMMSDFDAPTVNRIADEIEAEIERGYMRLPEGWESEQAASVLAYWPTWDDGSPCMFGDEFTCYPKYDFKNEYEVFDRLVIFGPNHVWSRGCDDEKPHDGGYYEWNFMRPGGDGCEEYRPTKRKPRTIEDVLREFILDADCVVCGCVDPEADMTHEEIEQAREAWVAKYAAELRELMEVGE